MKYGLNVNIKAQGKVNSSLELIEEDYKNRLQYNRLFSLISNNFMCINWLRFDSGF